MNIPLIAVLVLLSPIGKLFSLSFNEVVMVFNYVFSAECVFV